METVPTTAEIEAMTKKQRSLAVIAERAAEKEHMASGREGDAPATPVSDWMCSADYQARAAAAPTAGRGRPRGTAVPEGARWTYAGSVIVRKRPYGLAYMSQEHTRGIDGPGPVSTDRFREVLAALGVTDPHGASWDVMLPNGHRVGLVLAGDPLPEPTALAPEPTEPVAKKVPAKKATKSAPAKKAAASKAPVNRKTVTPITKASQTRNAGKSRSTVAKAS